MPSTPPALLNPHLAACRSAPLHAPAPPSQPTLELVVREVEGDELGHGVAHGRARRAPAVAGRGSAVAGGGAAPVRGAGVLLLAVAGAQLVGAEVQEGELGEDAVAGVPPGGQASWGRLEGGQGVGGWGGGDRDVSARAEHEWGRPAAWAQLHTGQARGAQPLQERSPGCSKPAPGPAGSPAASP